MYLKVCQLPVVTRADCIERISDVFTFSIFEGDHLQCNLATLAQTAYDIVS
jgi:hypothetical protein